MRVGVKYVEVNILQVLSPQQQEIYVSICRGASYGEIASRLGISKDTVKGYWKRIQKKIRELEGSSIDVIMDIFEEETNRSLPKNQTVKQMQFLSQSGNMHITEKITPAMKSYYAKKTERAFVATRQMTEDERKVYENRQRNEDDIPKEVKYMERLYRAMQNDPYSATEELATIEVILRAYGIINFTPAINKLNARTSKALRAKEEGYSPTIIKPGEGVLLHQGSKFLESVIGDDEKAEYAVWLVPKSTRVSAQ